MKIKKGILAFALVLSLVLLVAVIVIATPTSADINIISPDNHYLNDAKNVDVYIFNKDENGKITYEPHNLYEQEMARRAEPLSECFIEKLKQLGVGQARASKMTVGEYEDYIYNLPMDDDYITLLNYYGVSSDEYAKWTNMDAENYLYHINGGLNNHSEKIFTDEQIEKVNMLGITLNELETLMNMSFSAEEISKMTGEEVGFYLGKE